MTKGCVPGTKISGRHHHTNNSIRLTMTRLIPTRLVSIRSRSRAPRERAGVVGSGSEGEFMLDALREPHRSDAVDGMDC